MASVKLIIFAGRNLPGVDGGSADPYVTVIHNAQKLFRTKEKKKTTAPIWNQEFDIPRVRRTDVITLNVKHNTFGGSTLMGSCKVNLAAVEPNVPGEKTWVGLEKDGTAAGEVQFLVTYAPLSWCIIALVVAQTSCSCIIARESYSSLHTA